MFKLWRLAMLGVVVTCCIGAIFSVDRNYRAIARIDQSQEPTQFAGSPREPIVPTEPPDDVRIAEQSRRAVRPAGDPKRKYGLNYEGVLKGLEDVTVLPKPAEPMPPTYCRSIERARKTPTGRPDRTMSTKALSTYSSPDQVSGSCACFGSRMIAVLRSHRWTLTVSNWSAS